MENLGAHVSRHGIDLHDIESSGRVYWNLSPARLYEEALGRGEAVLAADGPLLARTGDRTGRSPNDRFLVRGETEAESVWWGEVNRPIRRSQFDTLRDRVLAHLRQRDLFVFDGYAGAHSAHQMPVRVITELAWHSLFSRNMFRRELDGEKLEAFEPYFTVISVPSCLADPQTHGTDSPTFILLDLEQRQVLIGGTAYAGEIKKSIFTAMNYLMPERHVLPMHCSANYGVDTDDVALFFGLSGTGKTTLSADRERTLIGDDEHGWSDQGVFNFEGGCYAKVIRLSPEGEPEIFATTRRFGTILENVVYDPESRRLDLDDDSLTENTRASYPLEMLERVDADGVAGHPRHVVFLTCDAFGVLPPLSRLSGPQALYQFLSGYTAKVAGTERGVTEPSATFSTCFGAPFMPRHPGVYAEALGRRLKAHGSRAWLINTGWTGGPYGVGERIALADTRRLVRAAIGGELDEAATEVDPVFGLSVPLRIEGVPGELLTPRRTWSDPAAYDERAGQLAGMFRDNFEQFPDGVGAEVVAAGPG
ncbi:MAG: phosphoenolpyruvate carboxykinase (ATP) [Thermoanaerobaculia bacterium]